MNTRDKIDSLFEGWSSDFYNFSNRPSDQPNDDPRNLEGLSATEAKLLTLMKASPNQIKGYKHLKAKVKVLGLSPGRNGDISIDMQGGDGGEMTVNIAPNGFFDHGA